MKDRAYINCFQSGMFLQLRTIMARVGIPKTKMSVLSSCREFLQLDRGFRRFARSVDDEAIESFTGSLKGEKNSEENSLIWIPHPRSGIYFPKGHEWVMEDVPEGAAALSGRTFWLRNNEGVENSDTEEGGHPD